MEGRYPKGILFVLTNCADPAAEDEFNEWYNRTHLPDLIGSGLFHAASRYQSVDPNPTAKYLAIYETDREDLAAVLQEVAHLAQQLLPQGRMYNGVELVRMAMFRRVGPEFPRSGKSITGILTVQTNCTQPTLERQFNEWYNGTHIPDMMATGRYHAAYRYEDTDSQPARGRYLAIYETDAADPAQASSEIPQIFYDQWKEAGRWWDAVEITWRAAFQRIWPT